MSRWLVLLGVGVIALLGVLWWQMGADPKTPDATASNTSESQPRTTGDPSPTTLDSGPGPVWRNPSAKTVDNGDSGDKGETELIDPKSETFNHRVDVVVGDKLRSAAAFDCDESGMQPDAELKVNYRLRIVNGRITVSDVRVMKSDVTPEYQRCFLDKIEGTTFRMDDMPDFEEADQELYTRVRSMKKYRSRAEFDD